MHLLHKAFALVLLLGVGLLPVSAQKKKGNTGSSEANKGALNAGTLSGLKFRSIGPALTSGRIIDFAVNPEKNSEYYVAVASGGVWKTTNSGTTYQPIFDSQGSYSIGCVTLDPGNPHTVWVGTGENNGQRSVGYGDGVYRSTDGGKSWKNVGLKNSEHIGKILVDPRNSQTVYAAAQGPLWKAGGDRGLYKTTDGGTTWKSVLSISEHTGVSDIAFDPRNPDVIYAASWQRRRHVWTFISGGPESMLFKSMDGGTTWDTLRSGLPSDDMGRIAISVSPVQPDVVYAIIEASNGKGGFFRSTDRGASWEKRNGYSTSGNYYQELYCDPKDVNKVYAMDTWGHVTVDGGKTWQKIGEQYKHVDNHAIWIDPQQPEHLMMGCDGGIYETWDDTKHWQFKANLPVTQFYRVAVDNSEPFYYVYGGTQDNFSLGGPSRNTSANGIPNSDWFITNGGDGFESQVDPKDPNIVYAQSQYGWLVRYDRKSGEKTTIKPMPGKGEPGYRWNWDAPLIISPHQNTRLYFAANKVFRSNDRGNTWEVISDDLSRQLDRNKLPVMDRVWGMDAVAKNKSTTIYGNIVTLNESPMKEGLLYAGTDDGLVHVTADGGSNWRKAASAPGVPERTYVNQLLASQHETNTVYGAFNNHKNGDFKPYLFKSTDAGQSWTAITKGLPERGSVYSIAEDHVNPKLLFAGTEFGVFVSINGGQSWVQLKGGLPTVAIRDMAIQKRENDLVLASFGRGFYVLDDYSALREMTTNTLDQQAHIFPVKDSWMYIESVPLGLRGNSFQGHAHYAAKNPTVGATFTFYLKESMLTAKEKRQQEEAKKVKAGEAVAYPDFEAMRAEDQEQAPYLLLEITDKAGNVVRRIKAPAKKGVHRLTWDFRYPSASPIRLKPVNSSNPFASAPSGHLAMSGTYSVRLLQNVNGEVSELVAPVSFETKLLNQVSLPAADRKALVEFQQKVSELQRAVNGTGAYVGELNERLAYLDVAVRSSTGADLALLKQLHDLEARLNEVKLELYGDPSRKIREFETPESISSRIGLAVYTLWESSSAPSQTVREAYRIAGEELKPILSELQTITASMQKIEQQLEAAGVPWTPGRLPVWNGG